MNVNELHAQGKQVSAQSLFKGENGSATAIHLKADAILKTHITKTPAVLLCINGLVVYRDETGKETVLQSGDYVNIEPIVKHWVEAQKHSNLLLLK